VQKARELTDISDGFDQPVGNVAIEGALSDAKSVRGTGTAQFKWWKIFHVAGSVGLKWFGWPFLPLANLMH